MIEDIIDTILKITKPREEKEKAKQEERDFEPQKLTGKTQHIYCLDNKSHFHNLHDVKIFIV